MAIMVMKTHLFLVELRFTLSELPVAEGAFCHTEGQAL